MGYFTKLSQALRFRMKESPEGKARVTARFDAIREAARSLTGKLVPSLRFRAGIDIGSRSASLVILERAGSRWILRGSALKEYGTGQKHEAVGELLRNLEQSLQGIVGRWACRDVPIFLAVSGKNEVVKRVVTPFMKHRELKEALLLRFERESSSVHEGVGMGYRIERQRTDGDDRMFEVTVSVVKGDILEDFVEPFENAGFADIRPVAVSLIYRDALVCDEPYLILDMGRERTGFYASVPGKTALYREVGMGGENLTEALTGRFSSSKGVLELTGEHAERLKKKYGVSSELIRSDRTAEEAYELIPEILKSELDKLIAEIRRTVQYMKSTLGSPPSRIFLSGGGSSLPGVTTYLREVHGVEVKLLEYPDTVLGTDEGENTPLPANLLTLALVGPLGLGRQGILRTARYRVRKLLRLERRIFRNAVATTAAFIAGYTILTQGITEKSKIDTVLMNYSTIMATDLGIRARKLNGEKEELLLLERFLRNDFPAGPDMVTLMRELSHIVPDCVMLTRLEIISNDTSGGPGPGGSQKLMMPESAGDEWPGPIIVIDGVIDAGPLYLEANLSNFNRILNESGLFEDVRLISWERSEEKRENVLTFSVMCSMHPWLRGA